MIGPAARRHFMRALQSAARAEQQIKPGNRIDYLTADIYTGLVEMIRGVSFAFLEDRVSITAEEEE